MTDEQIRDVFTTLQLPTESPAPVAGPAPVVFFKVTSYSPPLPTA
jgi:hypothetical protein